MVPAKPRIGIIVGSATDIDLLKRCREVLESFNEPYEFIVASAHRTPAKVADWTENAHLRGLQVIIAAAGAAAALPGVVAAHTLLPVVGLPLATTTIGGLDALYATVQMPPGIPVGSVAINNGDNAALLALAIVALHDPDVRDKIVAHRKNLSDKVETANEKLYAEHPQLRPNADAFPAAAPRAKTPFAEKTPTERLISPVSLSDAKTEPMFADPPPPRAAAQAKVDHSASRRVKIDPRVPNAEIVERAVDTLLDGGVIALPTDTVYGLAVDPFQPMAVEKLFAMKGRDREKGIALLLHSRSMLKSIASNLPPELEEVLSRHWPGALTVVLRKYPGSFDAIAPSETIAVRVPAHPVTQAILKAIKRPLAVTSANISGQPPLRSAVEIESALGSMLDMILDAGEAGGGSASTVLEAAQRPFHISREGAIDRNTLAAQLGQLLAG